MPVDLVIDHSVQVDHFGDADALRRNNDIEFERNGERYAFLRWGQKAFKNFRVIPPASGIVHQVNLEYLASLVHVRDEHGVSTVLPDSLVGTDSHTTMINGLGIVGWGVGGIEAEAVMLGQPMYMLLPQVVGMRLSGRLPQGATATDLVLTITQILRKHGVVEKFVEFFGEGAAALPLTDRATIANMAPEYGATMGYFPVDDESLRYLRESGRDAALVDLVERYYKAQGMFRTADAPEPVYTEVLELDLSTVVPCLAGPKRPQDRVELDAMQSVFRKALTSPTDKRGFALKEEQLGRTARIHYAGGSEGSLAHGDVVIAAITSCTNTSNPAVMLAAGLLARNAAKLGLRAKPHVKTSLAPGSKVVTDYLEKSNLLGALESVGFYLVGYGCTTCIGNSGPLPQPVAAAIKEGNLVVAGVLSGNRNFEGRVHALVKANYLASPPLVVAYALAGTVDIDFASQPVGKARDGRDVYLKEIWPTLDEVRAVMARCLSAESYRTRYAGIETGNAQFNAVPSPDGERYAWDEASTYIQNPPFFTGMTLDVRPIAPIRGARVLVKVGDSVTTDHISPAGDIPAEGPAGAYLRAHGVEKVDFNSFGSRRGNDRVMTRGTFANVRLRNQMAPGTEGGVTTHVPTGEVTSIYDAAARYQAAGVPTVVLAGADYGMGSSRDWAAKGTMLLGVKAVLATSFERIHRSNLVGMGVLPLEFADGATHESLGLTGRETFSIDIGDDVRPRDRLVVQATDETGVTRRFDAICRLDSTVDINYFRNGGILPAVLRRLAVEG